MIINEIYVFPSWDCFPSHFRRDFDFRSRFVCNYIERRLRAKKVNTNGIKRIAIECFESSLPEIYKNTSNVLVVPQLFSVKEYFSQDADSIASYYCNLIASAISRIDSSWGVPCEEIISCLSDFRDGGYLNGWMESSVKQGRCRWYLKCTLSDSSFRAFLVNECDGVEKSHLAIETLPDEFSFEGAAKRLKLEGGSVFVLDAKGNVVFSMKAEAP